MTEEKCSHMRALRNVAEGPIGTRFWASPTRARQMIASGEAAFVNDVLCPKDTGILRRSADWPENRFSTVSLAWSGATVVLIAGGPSVTIEDVARVESAQVKVIAVNDAYLLAPWADICYFADAMWHEWHTKGIAKPKIGLSAEQVREMFAAFVGEKCSIQGSGANIEDAKVHILRNVHGRNVHGYGLSADPGAVATGKNSGFQALNIAILAGAKTIILLGFDAREPNGGLSHWFGSHPTIEPDSVYAMYRKSFSEAEGAIKAAGVRVLNASPGSAIETFPKLTLAEALTSNPA